MKKNKPNQLAEAASRKLRGIRSIHTSLGMVTPIPSHPEEGSPTSLHLTCKACGATGAAERPEQPTPGQKIDVTLAHENDCPFLAAIESDTAQEWVAAHGYPIVHGPVYGKRS